MRITALFKTTAIMLLLSMCALASAQSDAQRTKFWTGGNGDWADAAHWSLSPVGAGGAGVPRVNENVVIAPGSSSVIRIVGTAWCNDLLVDGTSGAVNIVGPTGSELNIAGGWRMVDDVRWAHAGVVRLTIRRAGTELDLRGVELAADLVMDGSGSWSILSDVVLASDRAITLKQGTLIGNGCLLKAGELRSEGRSSKRFIGGSSMVILDQSPTASTLMETVEPGSSTLVVNGNVVPWDLPVAGSGSGARDVNVCGTGPGQTPIILNSSVTTDYNGFGVRCRNECNATVTVSVNGGVGPFTYQWLNGGPMTATWTTACGGPQIVIVTDQGQGISCPVTINVSEPAPLGVIFFGGGTPPTCPDVCNGSRTALGVGGVSPISYNWNNGAGTNSSFFQLCAGLNTLAVTDANGCQFDTTFFFNLQPLQPSLIFTPTSCFGICDGTAQVTPAGGTQPYTILWAPPPPVGQGTNTASGLCAGNWSVTITDFNGCDTTVAFAITEPLPIIPDQVSTDASCFGVCDGTATVTASGAPGPFTYTWSPSPGTGQGTGNVTGLCALVYQVTILDQSTGCDSLITVTIDSPTAIDLQALPADASCANTCDGTITLTPSGGQAPYSYVWTPAPPIGQGTPSVSGLCPGPWSVTVTDAGGCDTTMAFTINAPLPLDPGTTSTDVTCAGACDGTASANVSGGTPIYTYLWSPAPPVGQGTPNVSGLCAGPWSLTVTDANGCDTTVNFTILEPPPLAATPTQTNVSCGGACDGTASVAVSGGTPTYSYVWTPAPPVGQGTPDASGLCAGAHSVLITDANGCEITVNFMIDDPAPITASLQLQDATCPGICDGTAGVIAGGGAAPYQYLWQPAPAGGQGTPNATGLCPQAYTLTITDALGCDTTIAFTINQPAPIEPNPTVTDATCSGDCDGSVVLAPTGGTGVYTYVWLPAPPVGQGTSSATGLCAGNWSVTITSGACDTTLTFQIQEPPPLDVTLNSTDVQCAGDCDGTASVTVGGGVLPLVYLWSPAPPVGQGTPNVSGLCAGPWSLTVTDANGCDTTVNFAILEPPPLAATPTQTNVSCGGACDGTASVAVSGGTPAYSYVWTPAPPVGQGTPDASGLCAGAQSVLITDANGCEITMNFMIDDPAPIAASLQLQDATCPGICDGTAGVIAGGGAAPYQYLWQPAPGGGQGTPNATGLCPQAYTLTITDALGCDTTIAFTINQPAPIEPNPTVTDATCSGDCDGSVVLAPTGGAGVYTYVWLPAPPVGQGTSSATGLCAGNWSVTITSGACDTTLTIQIIAPPPIDATLLTTNLSCAGTCDGTASLTVGGGTLPYAFLWSPVPPVGQGTPNVSGLCAGAHSVTITDAVGCDTILAFMVLDAVPLVVDLALTEAGCGNLCAGTATATVSGGIAPYTYLWSPAPGGGQGTNTAIGLCSGFHDLTLTDAAGCDTTVQFLIVSPSEIAATPTVTDASCAGSCTGAIDVATIGGVPPYTYLWTPAPPVGQGTPNASGLCVGDWMLQINDAAACDTFLIVTINEPFPIGPNGTSTDETCNGPCDGTASVAPINGTQPYSYLWSPMPPFGQGTPDVAGLCHGDWSVTITDAGGCDTTVVFAILPNQGIDAGLVTVDGLCAGECDGSAVVTPSAGLAPYAFVWSPAPPFGQGTDSVSGLCAGLWQVLITDAAGCDTTVVFQIDTPPPFDVSVITGPENCAGPCTGTAALTASGGTGPIAILWQPEPGGGQGTTIATGLCSGTPYTVTLTDANGCDSTLAFTIDPFQEILPNSSSTAAICADVCNGTATVGPTGGTAPYTYLWQPEPAAGQGTPMATGLCPGVVEVTITDVNGCSVLAPILILSPDTLLDDATLQHIQCGGECDGSITLNVSGGTAPYTYFWSPLPPNGQGTNSATDLCAGDWSVTVTDAAGCDTTFSYTITEPAPMQLSLAIAPSECQVCSGGAQLLLSGGTPFFLVLWTDAMGNTVGFGDNVNGLCAGIYTVTVTDGNGCVEQLAVPITDVDGEVLTMVPGITSCPGSCDGTVSVVFNCMEPPCTISWADGMGNDLGESGQSLTDLCPGDYFVSVTNALGCISVAPTTVTEPAGVTAQISSSPVSCAGQCDGSAAIGVSGGASPYTFNWDPAPGGGQGTPFATGLCEGVYSIEIGYGAGCLETFTVLILEPDPLLVDDVLQPVSCEGECDAGIILSPSGGTAPYSYFWSPLPPAGQGTNSVSGLCFGDWSATVTDANGCSVTMNWTIIQPSALDVSATTTPSNCLVCNGTASTLISGGTAPYVHTWSLGGVVVSMEADPIGLCSGLYQLNVTDANGCSIDIVVPVQDSNAEVLTPFDGSVTCATDCDGQIGVDFICTEPPCAVEWTDAGGAIIAVNVLLVTDLCVGNYQVQVTNANGCSSIVALSVTPGTSIIPNLSSVPISCAGTCDGTATVGPVGGVGPYQFTWSPEPGGGQGTPMATGLCAGVYSVTINDAVDCDTTITVLILEPQPLLIIATVEDTPCNGTCEGGIVANAQGGVAPYSYSWDPVPGNGQGGNTALGLCAGSYALTLTDANGCTLTQSWIIAEPSPITLVGSSTQSECGLCNGTASVVAGGGTPGYQYLWSLAGQIYGTSDQLIDLCAGLYVVDVFDSEGCQASLVVPVTDVEGEETSTTDGITTCPGGCDGSVSVAVNCTDPPCAIAWFDAMANDLNESGNTVNDLCGGLYLVLVTNATGCVTVDTAFVLEPDPILPNLSTTPVGCFGTCDGTATVGPTGGAEPYVYLWDPVPPIGQGTPMAEGLCSGTWDVTITDTDGCSITIGALILEPPLLIADPLVTLPTCAGACDGSIVLSPQGGVAPYTYFWTPEPPNGQGTNSALDLCAGMWTVLVSDFAGCDTTYVFDLVDPPVLEAELSTTDNNCFGECLGTAEAVITGGTQPYAITWTDGSGNVIGQDVMIVTDLCAGDYLLNVLDGNGCALEVPFTINEGAPIDAGLLFTNESCFGPCDGTATVQPSGGIGTYAFLWVPDPAIGQGTDQVSGLCAGPWSVTITDPVGCDTTVNFIVLPFTPVADNAVATNVACNGDCSGSITLAASGGGGTYSFVWSPEPSVGQGTNMASGLCPGEWSVTITDGAGCDSTFAYMITEPPVLLATVDTVIPASCSTAPDGAISTTIFGGSAPLVIAWSGPDGYSSDQADINGLLPGDYDLVVTDANGCITTLTVVVDALIPLVADAGADQEFCAGVPLVLDGSATIGGLVFIWTDDQGNEVGNALVSDLGVWPPGTHTFTLTVSDGPCTDSDQVTITVLSLPIADAGPNQSIFLSGTVTLGGSPSGPAGSMFSWSPDTVLTSGSEPNPVADPDVTTWFFLTVTAPDGCVAVDSVLVTVIPDVDITSGFTPNGDGWNDVWVIDFIHLFPNSEVEIYNRWGELLFQSVGYRIPWDGRYNGGFVPVGTYYYVVKLNDPEFPEPYTGPLTVIR